MKTLTPVGHVSLAINDGDTTPVPGSGTGSIAWSSTLSSVVVWTGSVWRVLKPQLSTAITAQVVASNTAADVAITSITVPANLLVVGSTFSVDAYGTSDNGTTSGQINFWIKVGTTKILTFSVTTTSSVKTLSGWYAHGSFTFRTVGSSGTVIGALFGLSSAPSISSSVVTDPATTQTAATNAALSISFGFNWTAANASNIVRCDVAVLDQTN